nr:MAG TPA: hypothetical protein [Caudoviricetes sp.]
MKNSESPRTVPAAWGLSFAMYLPCNPVGPAHRPHLRRQCTNARGFAFQGVRAGLWLGRWQ